MKPSIVLLVEDVVVRRKLLIEELTGRGHTVHAVANVVQALRVLVEHRIDRILVSMQLADGAVNGLDVVARIRRTRRNQRIPVLLYRSRDLEVPPVGTETFDLFDVPDAVDEGRCSLEPEELGSEEELLSEAPRSVPTRTPTPLSEHPRKSELVDDSDVPSVVSGASFPDPLESQADFVTPEAMEDEIEGLKSMLLQDPDSSQLLVSLAARLYALKRDEELEPICRRLIERGHDLCATWLMVGDALYRMGRVDEAIDAWRFCIEVDDRDPRAEKAMRRIDRTLQALDLGVQGAVSSDPNKEPSDPPEPRPLLL